MASDKRDQSFEKALSRHLRSAAPSGAPANLSAGPAPQVGSCLDFEILAAYHERSLLPEETNSCKEHIAGCAHCQALLAQLEATDAIPLPALAKEEITAQQESRPAILAEKDQRAVEIAPQEKTREKTSAPRFSSAVRWPWLAPAGALAAALLVWIAWHENQQPHLLGPSEIKMAKVEPSTPVPAANSAPAATRQAPAASPEPLDALSKNSGAVAGAAPATISRQTESLKQQGKFDIPAKVAPSKTLSDKENELRKDAGRDSSAVLVRTGDEGALDAKNAAAGALQENVQVQAQAANIQAQNQQNQTISPRIPGPAPLNQAEPSKKAKSESSALTYRAAAPPPQAAIQPASTALEVSAVANPYLIAAPASSALWRAGRAGLIEFSSDNGRSWSRQTSGVLVDLLAGSAPSDKVCWIVGRIGAVLLTTDGGAHWSVVHSPVKEDLGGVRALDALHATVWNLRNTKTFETTDGGLTWKLVPAP